MLTVAYFIFYTVLLLLVVVLAQIHVRFNNKFTHKELSIRVNLCRLYRLDRRSDP